MCDFDREILAWHKARYCFDSTSQDSSDAVPCSSPRSAIIDPGKCAAGVQDVREEAEPSVANGTPWKAEEEPGREAAIQNANSLLFCQCVCCMDRPSKAPRLELQRVLDELQRIGDADLEDPGDAAREKWVCWAGRRPPQSPSSEMFCNKCTEL